MTTAESPNPSTNIQEISLYEKWKKLYPLWVQGRFQKMRRAMLIFLLLVFYVSPWLSWNGQQGVWFNIPERKFTILWTTFYPQEFVLLSWLLIISAFALFFFTVMAGRLWCGWACPQTMWTLCFQWIEKWVEGERNQRIRLDNGPWSATYFRKKALKFTLWGGLAFSIGFTFVGYFEPPRELLQHIVTLDMGRAEVFWILFPAAGSLLLAGILREQVCLHMCPYARFQSVMFDRDTMIISYDAERGDPRGSRGRTADPKEKGLGSCVDCKLCVNACPTGIDIRDGLQYECIGCAQCIDVCNQVMGQMGYAPNLIRYSSLHEDKHEEKKRVRPRLVGYGAVLVAMLTAFTWALSARVPLALDIIRDRNRLYREVWDGSVENVYTLTVMNREDAARTYRLTADGEVAVALQTRNEEHLLEVEGGGQLTVPVQLLATRGDGDPENSEVEFTIETVSEPSFAVTEVSRFVFPPPRSR